MCSFVLRLEGKLHALCQSSSHAFGTTIALFFLIVKPVRTRKRDSGTSTIYAERDRSPDHDTELR